MPKHRNIIASIPEKQGHEGNKIINNDLTMRVLKIDQSGLFDCIWYSEKNGINTRSFEDIIKHYIEIGSKAGLAPHPLFDVESYKLRHPVAEESDVTLLEHLIAAGPDTSMSPIFDPTWYRAQAGDIGDQHPMLHFLRIGATKGLSPHPLFDSKYYFTQDQQLALGRVNPLTHFIEHGARNGLNPNRFFNASWYISAHPGIINNPLIHFITIGASAGNQPHPGLDLRKFAKTHSMEPLDAFYMIVNDNIDGAIDRQVENESVFEAGVRPTFVDDLLRPISAPRYNPFRQSDEKYSIDTLPDINPDISVNIETNGIDVVSFDVWDTLLRRDCDPDEVKMRAARWLLLNGHNYIRPAFRTVQSLFSARLNAENASALNGEFEYRYELAIDNWLDAALVRGAASEERVRLRQGLLEHELAAELSSTRPDLPMRRAIESLPVPAIFASDFYMSADFLKTLLHFHGFGRLLTGFASSDRFETKRSGQMFNRLVRHLGTTPERLLHVGDNPLADVDIPRNLGIAATHYFSVNEHTRQMYFKAAFDALRRGDGSLHRDRITQLCAEVAAAQVGEGATLRAIGARLAPLAIGFILNVLEQALFDRVDKLFFFTREGLFLRRLYDAVVVANPYDSESPASEIIEVSRRATFAAGLEDIGIPQLMRLWTLYSTQSVKGLTNSLNLDMGVMLVLCDRFGLDFEEPVTYPWLDERIRCLLESEEFRTHALARCAEQREVLTALLVEKGFFNNGLRHVVDIGWRGTIHDNIARLDEKVYIRGHYLGLFRFLNEQPINTHKTGWLFNENVGELLALGDVAPLEMLTNGPGGSVTGYRQTTKGVIADKEIIPSEEDVICGDVLAMQEGILAVVEPLVRYVRLHGLTALDLLDLARSLVMSLSRHPPADFADAFNRLEHNETFGTGETQTQGGSKKLTDSFDLGGSAELHHWASERLASSRWPEAQIFASDTVEWWNNATERQRQALPLAFLPLAAPALQRITGSRLSVYVPSPIVASGGHRTIYKVVRALTKLGFNAEIFLEGIGAGIEYVEELLAGTPAIIHTQWHRHIPAEVALATIAHSSQFICGVDAWHKAYLVQDFESSFNPMSDAFLIGENSYVQGHHHFTIGNWLSHVINLDYGAAATPSGLGVDTSIYGLQADTKREDAVCFLYQPDKPRRAPLLGITALRLLRQQMPDVKIYVYGSDLPLHLDFPVENFGLIRDLSTLNALYNKCKVGLCISGSNPSRIPYEMMAAGCVPVDLYRYNNLMDHQAGAISLAYQDAASIAEAMRRILANTNLFESMSAKGCHFARPRTLDWEADVIANSLLAQIQGKLPPDAGVRLMFDDMPIISDGSRNGMVEHFCATHRALAERQSEGPSVSPTPFFTAHARSIQKKLEL